MNNQPYAPCVLDSSALIALIKKEKGAEIVEANIKGAVMSAVNYAEVVSVMVRTLPIEIVSQSLSKLIAEIEPFDKDMAVQSGMLAQQTQKYGLYLGDRACIALALEKGMCILTADKIWGKLDLNIEIKHIR